MPDDVKQEKRKMNHQRKILQYFRLLLKTLRSQNISEKLTEHQTQA